LGGGIGWWLRSVGFPLWWLFPVVVLHFFLFCNVFLVWRKWELLWAVGFVINVALHLRAEQLHWFSPCCFQLPLTLLVIFWQIRSPWYHGVFARQLNSRLDDFLRGAVP
jgi:hypothetical protein